jgi:hypothetical protein
VKVFVVCEERQEYDGNGYVNSVIYQSVARQDRTAANEDRHASAALAIAREREAIGREPTVYQEYGYTEIVGRDRVRIRILEFVLE